MKSKNSFFSFMLMIVFIVIVVYKQNFDVFEFGVKDSVVNKVQQALQYPKEIYLPDSLSEFENAKEKEKCHFFNCFNIFRCVGQEKIHVHIPDPKKVIKGSEELFPMSWEFVEIMEAVVTSEFYTEDPQEACVFLPALDILNELKISDGSIVFRSLEVASSQSLGLRNGENHLLFSLLPRPEFNHGRAMLAASGLSSLDYRTGFDISLPTYSILQEAPIHETRTPSVRNQRWLLLVPQKIVNQDQKLALLKGNLNSTASAAFVETCNEKNICNVGGREIRYSEALESSSFCLILKLGQILSNPALMEALHHGCIPVIAIDSLVLPFSEVIDWKRFSIRIFERDLKDVLSIVSRVSDRRSFELRLQGSLIYQKYFSNLRSITKTTLEILNDRIFSHHAKTYTEWNLISNLKNPLYLPATSPHSQGFTAVILSYDRWNSLVSVISRVSEAPSLSAIVVIWNHQEKAPPPLADWPKTSKPIRIITPSANKLSNRFYPYDEIETEAVLSLDDDIVMLTSDELEFGYQAWREHPDRLVGFPSRTHVWNNISSKWRYESEWTNDVSLILTGAAFYHKYWHFLFTHSTSKEAKEIRSWVDEHMNCEDLAFNFMISNTTGKAPIKVGPRRKFKCSTTQCTNTDSISGVQSHLVERSECLNMLVEKYGYMPLQSTEFRVDPVLYKDNLPGKLMKYPNIGIL